MSYVYFSSENIKIICKDSDFILCTHVQNPEDYE